MQVSDRFKASIPFDMPKVDPIENIRTPPRLFDNDGPGRVFGKINFSEKRDRASM
jgi:hypothetical protein